MPIYEYACKQCDTRFEKLVRSMKGNEKVECPKCGSARTARALSVFAVSNQGGRPAVTDSPACGRCGEVGPCSMPH